MSLSRLQAAHEALNTTSGKPSGTAAWFAAYALMTSSGALEDAAAAMQRIQDELKTALGGWRAPTGELLWIYAAVLAGQGKTASGFLKIRDALRDGEKASHTRKLHEGGSRAALVLSLADASSAQAVRRFFAIKQAILPPWWRANAEVTDLFAASHAARDDSPQTVTRARAAAMAVFEAERATRGLKREGARLSALYQQPARDVLGRYLALRETVKEYPKIRHAGSQHIWLEWAAQGLTAEDLPVIGANMDALDKVSQTGSARLRLAQLVWLGERADGSMGAVSAMSALIAAQTAAIIAITAATTAAVATTTGR